MTLDPRLLALERVLGNYVSPHRVGDAAADALIALNDLAVPATPLGPESDPFCELAASEIPNFGTTRDTHRCAKAHRDKPLWSPPGEGGEAAVEAGQGPKSAPVRTTGGPRCKPWCGRSNGGVLMSGKPSLLHCTEACRDAGRPLHPSEPPPAPGPTTCPTCKNTRQVLYVYPRGPGDAPGNQVIPCPTCCAGEPTPAPAYNHTREDSKLTPCRLCAPARLESPGRPPLREDIWLWNEIQAVIITRHVPDALYSRRARLTEDILDAVDRHLAQSKGGAPRPKGEGR